MSDYPSLAWEKAREKAIREASLMWPEHNKEERERETDRLTLIYYSQYMGIKE